jgi:hypothetical protein
LKVSLKPKKVTTLAGHPSFLLAQAAQRPLSSFFSPLNCFFSLSTGRERLKEKHNIPDTNTSKFRVCSFWPSWKFSTSSKSTDCALTGSSSPQFSTDFFFLSKICPKVFTTMNRLLNLRFYKIGCFSPSPTLPWLFCPFKFFFVSIYQVVVCNLEFILPYGKWVPFVVKRESKLERQTIFTREDSTKKKTE